MAQYRTAGPARAFELARLAPPPQKEPRFGRITRRRAKTKVAPAEPRQAPKKPTVPAPKRHPSGADHRGLGSGVIVGSLIGLLIGAVSLLAFELNRRDALEDLKESLTQNETAPTPTNTLPNTTNPPDSESPSDELNRPEVLPSTLPSTFDEPAATGPTVIGTSPVADAEDVSSTTVIAISFSESMDETSLLEEGVVVYQNGKNITNQLELQYIKADRSLLLTPQSPFKAGATIEVRITRSALSTSGEPLRQAELVSFVIASQ